MHQDQSCIFWRGVKETNTTPQKLSKVQVVTRKFYVPPKLSTRQGGQVKFCSIRRRGTKVTNLKILLCLSLGGYLELGTIPSTIFNDTRLSGSHKWHSQYTKPLQEVRRCALWPWSMSPSFVQMKLRMPQDSTLKNRGRTYRRLLLLRRQKSMYALANRRWAYIKYRQ